MRLSDDDLERFSDLAEQMELSMSQMLRTLVWEKRRELKLTTRVKMSVKGDKR